MEKSFNLFTEINNGNKQAIKSFILSTRTYALNYARNIVDDDNKAIELVENAYNKIFFNEKLNNNKDYIKCLDSAIKEAAKTYISSVEIKDIDKVDSKIELKDIDVDKYKNYYNNPKVEKVIYETINALPKQEKEIVIRSYFGGETISDIAKDYKVKEETIESYINSANNLIEEKSKLLFAKYKIETANYKNAAIVYSTIKNIISFATLDVLGITVDKLKDLAEQDDDKDEKDLKTFVSDILKDLVQDWFLDRIRSLFVISTISAEAVATETATSSAVETVAAATATKAAVGKTAVSIVAKKVIIGVAAAAVATTGGVVAYNSIATNKEEKQSEIVETKTSSNLAAEAVIDSMPVSIEFYSENGDENIDSIEGSVYIPMNEFDESNMKKIEVASIVISGLDLNHEIQGDNAIVNIKVNKNKINTKLLDFIKSLGILDESTVEKLQAMLTMNSQELNDYLTQIGFSCIEN